MRIATWNVNSLKARLERVQQWIERAAPDVLLLQETKLTDADAPRDAMTALGYELAHHGEGRWNGVAIATRVGIADVVTNFGAPLAPERPAEGGDEQPLSEAPSSELRNSAPGVSGRSPDDEARMIAATCGGVRVVSVYVPNGRALSSPFYRAKLAWLEKLATWVKASATPGDALVIGGDFNIAPTDRDVWNPAVCHGGTHVSPPERAAFDRLCAWGFVDAYRKLHEEGDRYTWWDYRAGDFHKNKGMRIDHLLVTAPIAARAVASEIDREARKGKPTPSDHAPLTLDLDAPGRTFDAGWESAAARIAARRK